MADLQLPDLGRGAAGIDQAIELLRVVTGGLKIATAQAEQEVQRDGGDSGPRRRSTD